MAIFNCSPYDRGQLIRVIEYAMQKKKEDLDKKIITKGLYKYDIDTYKKLLDMLNGKSSYAGYYGMSKLGREKFTTRKIIKKEDDTFWKK